MREIKWEKLIGGFLKAKVGSTTMYCERFTNSKGNKVWNAHVCILGLPNFPAFGLRRKSLAKAKEDAVRIAREALIHYQTCLTAEMKMFGLVGGE